MNYDLHIHSEYSDGTDSFRELLLSAKALAIDCVSFTDHDHTESYTHAVPVAEALGIRLIPGVEISAYDREVGKKAHVLGYGYRLPAEHIRALCDPVLAERSALSHRQLNLLIEHGYDLKTDPLCSKSSHRTLYKQEIMYAITGLRYRDDGYRELYRKLFQPGGICAGEIGYPSIRDAVDAIHADGGLAFLAHPGQQDLFDRIPRYAESGLDGIEVYHPDHGDTEVRKALALAEDLGLMISGGSDYHGQNGANPSLFSNPNAEPARWL